MINDPCAALEVGLRDDDVGAISLPYGSCARVIQFIKRAGGGGRTDDTPIVDV
jgi:hypothetical protein